MCIESEQGSRRKVKLNNLQGRTEHTLRFLERLSAWTAGALLVINIADVLLGIFCRYVLKNSIIWTEELARFSLVWLVLMAAGGAYYHGDHMVIDFVVHRFPPALRKVVYVFRLLLTVSILSLMIYLGTVNAISVWEMHTMALHVPKTIPLLAVPLGFGLLLAIYILKNLLEGKGGWK